MAGQFSKANRSKRPGAFFNWKAVAQQPNLPSTTGIVAIPFTHSWGPNETVVPLASFGQFLQVFGIGASTAPYSDGYRQVEGAFKGEGLQERGGADLVLAYRMTGSSAAKATKALSNGTVPAITLTAVYEGSYGNRLKVAVVANAKDPTNLHDLVIYDQTIEVERWTYAKANITALATLLAASHWVTAGSVTSGTALTIVGTPTAFTGGDDGATVLAGDVSGAQTAFGKKRFGLYAHSIADDTILASTVTWIQTLNAKGKRCMAVVGGLVGDVIGVPATTGTAANRSTAIIADPNFVNLGGFSLNDEKHGVLSSAQLASRVAGMLAQFGETQGLSFGRLAGTSLATGPSDSEADDAIAAGVTTVAEDSHPLSPVRIDKGVTAFTSTTDPDRPYPIYSVPKFMRTMHAIEREITEFSENDVIARMGVSDTTAEYLIAQFGLLFKRREGGSIQPGWSIIRDPDPPPSPTDDFIALQYSVTFERDLEQILNTVTVA